MSLLNKITAAIQQQRGETARVRAAQQMETERAQATLEEFLALQAEVVGHIQALTRIFGGIRALLEREKDVAYQGLAQASLQGLLTLQAEVVGHIQALIARRVPTGDKDTL